MYNTSNLSKYRSAANTSSTNILSISKKPNQSNNQPTLKNPLDKVRELSPSTPNRAHRNSCSYQNILQKIVHTNRKPENNPDIRLLYKSNAKTQMANGQSMLKTDDRESRKPQSRNSFLDKSANQDAKLRTPQQTKIILERPYSSSKSKKPLTNNYASSKEYKTPISNFTTNTNDIQRPIITNEDLERFRSNNPRSHNQLANPFESKRKSSPEAQPKRCLSSTKLINRDMALDLGADTGNKPIEEMLLPLTTVHSSTNKHLINGLRSTKARRHSQLENTLTSSTKNSSGQLLTAKSRNSTRVQDAKNNGAVAIVKESLNRLPHRIDPAKVQKQNLIVNSFSLYKSRNTKDNSAAQEQPTSESKRSSSKRSLTSRNLQGQFGKENNDVEMSNFLKENLITRFAADQDEQVNSILGMLPRELAQTPDLTGSGVIEKTNSSNISLSRRKTIEEKANLSREGSSSATKFPKYKRSQSDIPYNILPARQEEPLEYNLNEDYESNMNIKRTSGSSEALTKEIQKQIQDLKARNLKHSKSAAKIRTIKEAELSIDSEQKDKLANVSPARIGIYDLISKNVQQNIKNKISENAQSRTPSSKTPSQEISILSISSEEREAKKAIFKRDYIVGKEIGQGAYAVVRTGMHKPTNTNVAIKIYEKQKIAEPLRRKSVRREIKVMERMNHMNVIKIFDIFETRKYVSIVMEFVDGKSLYSLVKSQPNRRLKESHAFIIFRQLIEGLSYCHDRCITHRDIKLENVLINRLGIIKIIDFGFTTCIPNDKKVKLFCGTPCYMAPEIVTKQEYCGPPVDIWAAGILLYVLMCGTFPFKGDSNPELFKIIAKGEFTIPDYVPDVITILIRRMLNVDPDKRPTAKEILGDPWFIYQSVLQNKKSSTKHRRSMSAEKTRSERFENVYENFYSSKNNWLSNSGKMTKDDDIDIVNKMRFEVDDNTQEPLDLRQYHTNPQTVKHDKRSKTALNSRSRTTRFIFDEDSELSKADIRRSNERMFDDIRATINGNLDQKDTYDEQKIKRRLTNEQEFWNTGDYLSHKSGKKGYDKYSILNKTIGLSRNFENKDVSPTRYDPKFIKNLVKMGYTEDEVISGLKDKNAVISTVYNWLVESKAISKASLSAASVSLETVTSNDNSYNMTSPVPQIKKKRTLSNPFTKQTPSTNISTDFKNINGLASSSSNVFKVNTILNREHASTHPQRNTNNGFKS